MFTLFQVRHKQEINQSGKSTQSTDARFDRKKTNRSRIGATSDRLTEIRGDTTEGKLEARRLSAVNKLMAESYQGKIII